MAVARGSSAWAEGRSLLALAAPIVVSLAAAVLIGVVDTIMVAPLGAAPLAAVSLTASAEQIALSAIYGLISGIAVRMAEAHGAGDADRLSAIVRTALPLCACAGVLGAGAMTAALPLLSYAGQPPEALEIIAPYWIAKSAFLVPFALFYTLKALFDAIDRPWLGVCFAFVAVGLNIPANYLLIYGVGAWEGFGLLGAGLASLLSETVSLLLGVVAWRYAAFTAPARRAVRARRSEAVAQLRVGGPVAVAYVGEGAAFAALTFIVGLFGVATLAAYQIVSSIGTVLYMLPLGMSMAVSLRIGQALGAGDRSRLRPIGVVAITIVTAWMAAVMIALVFLGRPLAAALSDDAPIVALAAGMFVVLAAIQIADGLQSTAFGALRGLSDTRVPVLVSLGAAWLISLPLAGLLGFALDLGPNGVLAGYGVGLLAAGLALTWRFFAATRPSA